MQFLISWLILSLAVWLTALVLPGVRIRSFGSAIVVAAIFGVLNFFLGWLLMLFAGVLTLGVAWLLAFITRWIIDAIFLKITDSLSDRISVDSFWWALGAALLMSAFGTVGEAIAAHLL